MPKDLQAFSKKQLKKIRENVQYSGELKKLLEAKVAARYTQSCTRALEGIKGLKKVDLA